MQKTFPLSKVVANPFRNMDRYPINEEKISELCSSMESTGFWENVVCRLKNNKYELAYGHHRWIAYKKKYGDKAKITLIIRDVSDEDMLRMMANENMDEWNTSAALEQETVRAVVLAYAEGKIKLEKPRGLQTGKSGTKGGGGIRLAPTFKVIKGFHDTKTLSDPKFYNAESIGKFLGWMKPSGQVSMRIRNGLAVLETQEKLAIPDKDMAEINKDLKSNQSKDIAEGIAEIQVCRTVQKVDPKDIQKEVIKTAKELANRFRAKPPTLSVGGKGRSSKASPSVGEEVTKYLYSNSIPIPTIEKHCRKLSKKLVHLVGNSSQTYNELSIIVHARNAINDNSKKEVTSALRTLGSRCIFWADCIEGKQNLPERSQILLTEK